MKVQHRFTLSVTRAIQKELLSLGVKVQEGFATFLVDEEHPSWSELRKRLATWDAVDVVSTEFTPIELKRAKWLELVPDWHYGFPQPNEDEFGYREATFDLSEYCNRCGLGMKQKAPFQMKGEPRWGKRSIFQLNWVFDEYFVTPEVWTSVFKPHKIESRAVTNTKGAELQTVVQLVTHEEVGISTNRLVTEECPSCGRIKYLPVAAGYFPTLTSEPSTALAKTKEYFGSGASAHKGVLVSREIARALAAENVLGASLRPVADPERGYAIPGSQSSDSGDGRHVERCLKS